MNAVEYTYFKDELPSLPSMADYLTVEQAKNQLAFNFQTLSQNVHNASWDELQKIYENWKHTSEESLASLISAELEKYFASDLQQQITGAGYSASQLWTQFDFARTDFQKLTDMDKYVLLKDELDNRIDVMCSLLERMDLFEEAALLASVNSKLTDEELIAKYNLKTLSLDPNKKFDQVVASLKNNYENLTSLSSGGNAVHSLKSGKDITPDNLAASIRGALNTIAGEAVFENLVIHISNILLKKGKQIDKQIMDLLVGPNGQKRISGKTLDIAIQGEARQAKDFVLKNDKQGKPDFYIDFTENGVTLTLGGSVKLKQKKSDFSNGVFKGSIDYSTTINGLWQYLGDRGTIFPQILHIILESRGTTRYAYPSAYADVWEAAKHEAIYLAFLDKFVGNGTENQYGEKNFADFIVVNQYVVPFWEIIQDVASEKEGYGSHLTLSGEGVTWKFDTSHFAWWRKRKTSHLLGRKTNAQIREADEREALYQKMLSTIRNKKIQMSLNLGLTQ